MNTRDIYFNFNQINLPKKKFKKDINLSINQMTIKIFFNI